jgi:putative transposase
MSALPNRKLNRLQGYDYSQSGYYFVTICTKNRINWFGAIEHDKVILNASGYIVRRQWEWLAEQYPYVHLDAYAVMPDHIHGIIQIVQGGVGNGRDRSVQCDHSLRIKSLSELIGAFKTTSSKSIHETQETGFAWQKSFHDHIIRNERSLNQIREYIVNNPIV